MHYLAYVHKDPGSAWSATFPDFPGCFTAADDIQALPRMAQEAVQVHFEDENLPIPRPSIPEDWAGDARFTGGYWVLLDIDLSQISAKSVRLNISLPERLLGRIDAEASVRRLSRSAFLALAAEREMLGGLPAPRAPRKTSVRRRAVASPARPRRARAG